MQSGCNVEATAFYFPSRAPFLTPLDARDVRFATTDGLSLHGWFMPAVTAHPGGRAPTVLHVHGNAGNVDGHAAFSKFLTSHGFNVFVFDYRSYGRSDLALQPLRRDDLLADARAALRAVRERADVDPDRIAVFGVSLGGALGLTLAAQEPEVRCVVSVSAFDSWRGIAGAHVPVLGPMLISNHLSPDESIARLGARPVLLVHGRSDRVVPFACVGRLLAAAQAAGVPARLLALDAGHNDILIQDAFAQTEVATFMQRAMIDRPSAHRRSDGGAQ